MTEEKVTTSILKFLIEEGWEIITFDYPQSGTGILLQPNNSTHKNKDAIILDIIAIKDNCCLIFENKDRYYKPDFKKLNHIKVSGNYSESINSIINKNKIDKYYFIIGIPSSEVKYIPQTSMDLVDYICTVDLNENIVFEQVL